MDRNLFSNQVMGGIDDFISETQKLFFDLLKIK